jgi:gamma-glutamylputrescine oxidase
MSRNNLRQRLIKGSAKAATGMMAATVAATAITPLVLKEKLVFDSNSSLWAKDQPPKNPPLADDINVDVAIIGGGYTGLSSAYHLKTLFPGKSVVILEARGVGHGASGRNGGMLLTQPSSEYMHVAQPRTHKLTYDVTAQCVKEVAELMMAHGLGSGVRLQGSLLTNTSEAGARRSRAYAEKAAAIEIPIAYWDRERIAHELGTEAYYGGLYDPHAAEVNPMKMVHALKRSAEKAGAIIYEDSPVLKVKEGAVIQLSVGDKNEQPHRVQARAIVLATNGYSSKLGYLKQRMIAAHTEMAATPPLDASVFAAIGWNNRIPFHDDRVYLYHVGSTADNRITIGAGNAEYFFNNSLIYKKDLHRRRSALYEELVRIYPGLAGVKFEFVWSGVLSLSFDMSPAVGVTGKHNNVYYGIGYAGHGVCLAYLFGKIIADLYAGEGGKWEKMPFFQGRFLPIPPEPLKWLSVKAYMAFLRLLDSKQEVRIGTRGDEET